MKTMTCRELGGPCDRQLSARSWHEMVQAITQHVVENHPATAKQMENMHRADPQKWGREMKPKWEAKPSTQRRSSRPSRRALFHGHRFRKIPWLVDVGSLEHRDVIREQL